MHYLTYTDIERYLNITLEENGVEYVDSMIPAIEDYVDHATNRTWKVLDDDDEPIEFEETFDGSTNVFFPKYVPVKEIIGFTVDGSSVALSDVYSYGSLIKTGERTATGYRNVVCTYTSDAVLPEDLKLAMIKWVSQGLEGKEEDGKTLKRAKIGQVEMEYVNPIVKDVPDFMLDAIARYRLPTI